jgi:hypothetical protein
VLITVVVAVGANKVVVAAVNNVINMIVAVVVVEMQVVVLHSWNNREDSNRRANINSMKNKTMDRMPENEAVMLVCILADVVPNSPVVLAALDSLARCCCVQRRECYLNWTEQCVNSLITIPLHYGGLLL